MTVLPPDYVESQVKFYERAYLEVLDLLSDKLDARKVEEKHDIPLKQFKTMFTADGRKLSSLATL